MEWNEHVRGPIIINMSQDFTTYESQESQEIMMPYGRGIKRRRSSSGSGVSKSGKWLAGRKMSAYIPRSLGVPKDNRCTIPLTTFIDLPLTADVSSNFVFDTTNVYVVGTGATTQTIPGATEVHAVFDLMRVAKVEITILPAASELSYASQTITTGTTNIPYVYHAYDPSGNAALNGPAIRQLATVKMDQLRYPIRRTIYPRLEGGNGVIDVGINRKNMFEKSGSESSQRWRGFALHVDMDSVVWTYGQLRVNFKVFYECMSSK